MKLTIYELKINDAMSDEAEVKFVALVDAPAIKKVFNAFKEEFIEPSKGEHEADFISRCIAYVVNEGKDTDQSVAICNSLWQQHFAGTKVSIDYDDTLSTERGKELAKRLIANGDVVYIISARQDKEGMLSVAKELGIPESRVYATGSNKAKVEKIKELDISKHYDNNADVVKELGSKIRYGARYFKEGTNVNFAEKTSDNSFKVRTYERGVEDETLSCGTGVTAVALAMHALNETDKNLITLKVQGGELQVSFDVVNGSYKNIWLIGPATFVYKGTI